MCYLYIRCFEVFGSFLLYSLFVDYVGATYEQEAPVYPICTMLSREILYHTRSLQIFQMSLSC